MNGGNPSRRIGHHLVDNALQKGWCLQDLVAIITQKPSTDQIVDVAGLKIGDRRSHGSIWTAVAVAIQYGRTRRRIFYSKRVNKKAALKFMYDLQ